MFSLRHRAMLRLPSVDGEELWPVAIAAVPDLPEGHPRRRTRVAVVASDGTVVVLRMDSCEPERIFVTGIDEVIGFEAHRDGRRLVLADGSGDVEVWDLLTGVLEARVGLDPEWEHIREPARSLALILDGRFALVSMVEGDEGPDCFQVLYDLEGYEQAGFLHMGPGPIELVAGTSAEGFLFEASTSRGWLGASYIGDADDDTSLGWRVDQPPPTREGAPDTVAEAGARDAPPGRSLEGLRFMTVLQGADLAASGGADGTIEIWDEAGLVNRLHGHKGAVLWVAGAQHGVTGEAIAVSVGEDHTLRLWDIDTIYSSDGSQQLDCFHHDTPLRRCTITSDGETVVVIDAQSRLLVFEVHDQ